jgi:hypothetical protein
MPLCRRPFACGDEQITGCFPRVSGITCALSFEGPKDQHRSGAFALREGGVVRHCLRQTRSICEGSVSSEAIPTIGTIYDLDCFGKPVIGAHSRDTSARNERIVGPDST